MKQINHKKVEFHLFSGTKRNKKSIYLTILQTSKETKFSSKIMVSLRLCINYTLA